MARDLRLFYLFRLLSTSYLFVPVSFAFAISRGLGAFEILLLNTIYCGAVIVAEVPTGALADRMGRRSAMMLGALAMVAACATYSLAHSFVVFAAAELLAALSMTLCSGADSAYLFDLLNDHGQGQDYPRREGTASAWHQGGQTLAFATGGLLGAYNLALPYLVSAGVASMAFVVALSMRKDRPHPSAELPTTREIVDHMRDAVHSVAKNRKLKWLIAYSAVVFVLLRSTIYIYQPYLHSAGYTIGETGLIFAGVYLIAAFVAHHVDDLRRRMSAPIMLWGLLGVLATTFLVLGAVPSGQWALAVLALQAAANGLYSPLVKPLVNHEIDDSRRRATVLSVESMVRRALFGLFSPCVGMVLEAWSTPAALTACGLFGLVGMGWLVAKNGVFAPAESALPAKSAESADNLPVAQPASRPR
jgi:MFS family permease